MDRRRRLAIDRRPEGRPPLSADRARGKGHPGLPRGPHHYGLSTGASAWFLLRHLDGRSRAVPAAQRRTGRHLKAMTVPYPEKLSDALIRRFRWEASFSIGNAQSAAASGDQAYVAGCAFRSLACAAQVLYAINRRYLINEKSAVEAAAALPLTIDNLSELAGSMWRAIGNRAFAAALGELGSLERELGR